MLVHGFRLGCSMVKCPIFKYIGIMSTLRTQPEPEQKRPRLTPEERAQLLADMKKDFDAVGNDTEKMKHEREDRDFWNRLV